jgi:hypothetical protein
MSWMQRTITQIQKAAYGKYQIADVQKNRLTPSPSPLAIAHQPSQRPTTRVDSTTQPQHTAKLAMGSRCWRTQSSVPRWSQSAES